MALVIVERSFEVPVEFGDIQAQEDAAGACFALHGVRFLRTYHSADRLRMLCLYEAVDAESVRIANRQARLPFDRAWTATEYTAQDCEQAPDAGPPRDAP